SCVPLRNLVVSTSNVAGLFVRRYRRAKALLHIAVLDYRNRMTGIRSSGREELRCCRSDGIPLFKEEALSLSAGNHRSPLKDVPAVIVHPGGGSRESACPIGDSSGWTDKTAFHRSLRHDRGARHSQRRGRTPR